jgi:hypothetical protein
MIECLNSSLYLAIIPVSLDGRNDVYGKFFDDCLNVTKEDKPAGQVIKETGANAVLTTNNGSIDATLKESPEWKAVCCSQQENTPPRRIKIWRR